MKKLYILMLATAMILVAACNKEEKLKVEELQQELMQLQNSTLPGVSDPVDPAAQSKDAYGFTFDAVRYGVDAAGSVAVGYSLPVASTIEVFTRDGWSAVVNAADDKSGTITVTAPDPASPSEVVVKATTADGRTTAASLPVMVRDPYTDATRTDVAALAYNALYTSIATDYHFQKLVECGMNMLSIEYSDNWQEQLVFCEKYGLKGVLFVNGPAGAYYKSHGTDLTIDGVINTAKNYPALAAYQIFDEPSTINISQINFEKDRIEMNDPDHPVYVNLHQGGASVNSLGVESYAEYVETFVTECNLKFITFDQYPVFEYGIDPSWNRALWAVHNASKKYNIPFWAFTLCCREWEREDPSLENIRLQCNTNLAFGAQVNQFFVYRSTSGTEYAPLQTWVYAPNRIDKIGVPPFYTAAYDDCQAYCREMHSRGYVFSDCNVTKICNTQVFSPWSDNLGTADLPPQIKSLSTAGEALVSFIENKGNEYIVIVNKLWKSAQSISFELDDMIYLIDHDGVFHEYQPGSYNNIPLEPGDMIVLKYE